MENTTNHYRSNCRILQFSSMQNMGNHRKNLFWPQIVPTTHYAMAMTKTRGATTVTMQPQAPQRPHNSKTQCCYPTHH